MQGSRARTARWIALLLGAVVLGSSVLAGCGGGNDAADGTHVMPDGSTMSDQQMKSMDHAEDAEDAGTAQPSEAAAMICSEELRDAVTRLFKLTGSPSSSRSFHDSLFECNYALPAGELHLSVKDLTTEKPGRAYFDDLRDKLAPVKTISGMTSLGFPAFEDKAGNVVFLNDHKTLRVDASGLPSSALPPGYTRTEAAYSLASSVLACWTE